MSSSSVNTSVNSRTICECGYQVIVKVSNTQQNPGRRFYGCAIRVCGIFGWVDLDPNRTVQPNQLADLHNRIRTLQTSNEQYRLEFGRLHRMEFELLRRIEEQKMLNNELKKENVLLVKKCAMVPKIVFFFKVVVCFGYCSGCLEIS
ncbi:hypothetical protein IFM89_006563 [Coptis chinensis]|uniref:GRF-type domain-containing protein n=1 Tax=Coptis chinensis TaxID=261450 RepID=A0A835MD47_9MAGN|nr:hypothetical protein IFM89_006563 [Coptis chinensis]